MMLLSSAAKSTLSCMAAGFLALSLYSPKPQANEFTEENGALHIADVRRRVNEYLSAKEAAVEDRYKSKGTFSGAILVAIDGKVVISRGYGYANREWNIPATPDTKLRIWSITKTFTAIAIMQLQEQGKLSISDSICKFLDDCPKTWREVTVKQLLTHTSGLPNTLLVSNSGEGKASFYRTKATPDQIIQRYRGEPFKFPPGTHYEYNNFGYLLAGVVIEKVTGKSYEDVLKEQIFSPLGMNDTGVDHPEPVLPKRASYYYDDFGDRLLRAKSSAEQTAAEAATPVLTNGEYVEMSSWFFSAGALYSTVEDLLKFDEALYGTALLKRSTLEQMWTRTTIPVIGESTFPHYGIGWELQDFAGRKCFSHVGAGGSGLAHFMHFPDQHVLIVILANSTGMGGTHMGLPVAIFGGEKQLNQ